MLVNSSIGSIIGYFFLTQIAKYLFILSVMIDLCDERGYLKKLSQNLGDYADKFLNQRTKYVVVGVESKYGIFQCYYFKYGFYPSTIEGLRRFPTPIHK